MLRATDCRMAVWSADIPCTRLDAISWPLGYVWLCFQSSDSIAPGWETVYLFRYPRGYFTNWMNHALEWKIHGLWPVARGKKHAREATVTVETVALRASGPVKEVQGKEAKFMVPRSRILRHWRSNRVQGVTDTLTTKSSPHLHVSIYQFYSEEL